MRIIDSTLDSIVMRHAKRGAGTGGASQILSGHGILILIILAAQLFKDQQYLVLLFLGALVWTRGGIFALLGAAIYFVATKYWTGVGLLLVYCLLSMVSVELGTRNIKRLLLLDKPMIGPFEGLPLVRITVLECLFLAGALLASRWLGFFFWCFFAATEAYSLWRYWSRLRPQWKQVHCPLMFRYAACAGFEAGLAEREQREFCFHNVAKSLLKSVYQYRKDHEVETFLSDMKEKLTTFADQQLIENSIRKRKPPMKEAIIQETLQEISNYIKNEKSTSFLIRCVIAEIVGDILGDDVRGEYLVAIVDGTALQGDLF